MADIYPQIFEVVFSPLKNKPLLALVPKEPSNSTGKQQSSGAFHVPRDLFPPSAEVYQIPGEEQMIAATRDIIIEHQPECMFILSPFLSPRFLSSHLRADFPGLGMAEILLQVASETASKGTQIGTLLPRNILEGEGARLFRERLFSVNTLRWCIVHEHAWLGFDIHASFRMDMLVFEVGRGEDAVLRFFRIPELTMVEEMQKSSRDLERLAGQGGGTTEFGYVLRDGLPAGTPLRFDLYNPTVVARQHDMANFGSVSNLGEVVDSVRTLQLVRDKDLLASADTDEGIPIIEGRDIRGDDSIAFQDTRYRAQVPVEWQLKTGDFCIRAIQGSRDRIHAAEIKPEMLPLAAANSVIVLRPKSTVTSEERSFLLLFLKSNLAGELFRARSSGVMTSLKSLLSLPVPVPDPSLTLALQSLNESASQFALWKSEAENARNSLFEYQSAKDMRIQILSLGRLTRQRQEAARMAEDFQYRVRTQFPHPIAFRWRSVQASIPNLDGYMQVLDCAEVTLAFLAAIVMIVSISKDNLKISWLEEMAKRLSRQGKQGTNMGDWFSVLQEVADSKNWRKDADQIPFLEVARLLSDETTTEAVMRLKDWRDDQAHGRGPKGDKRIESAFHEAVGSLETVLRSADFLCEYPLRYIEATHRDSFRKVTHYDYRDIVGDHPLVPISHGETPAPELEARSLYLVDRDGALHLMRPFITRRECPECGRWSTYYLDTYDKRGQAVILKSMEHEHTLRDADLVDPFRQIGLLT